MLMIFSYRHALRTYVYYTNMTTVVDAGFLEGDSVTISFCVCEKFEAMPIFD